MRKIFSVLLFVVCIAPIAGADEDLQITKGTMQVGGNLTFSTNVYLPEQGDNNTGFVLQVSPMFGYFVADSLELTLTIGSMFFFGDLQGARVGVISIMIGGRYILDIGTPLYFFIGAAAGMGFDILDEGETQKALAFAVPLGILVPLNNQLALTFGASFGLAMSLEEGRGTNITVPVGFLGVEGFF